jgi:CheY-like chemotaxis protein
VKLGKPAFFCLNAGGQGVKGAIQVAIRKKFGEILVEAGLLSEKVLQSALFRQKETGRYLGQVLEEYGLVTEHDIATALAKQFNIQIVRNIASHSFSPRLLALCDSHVALKKSIFPLKLEESKLYLAMANPLDIEFLDSFSFKLGLTILPCVTTRSEIVAAVNKHYLYLPEVAVGEVELWTILIVGTQGIDRSATVAALQRGGVKVMQANNGAEGLKVAMQSFPHLIVSDTIMPRMSGDEMIKNLQSNPRTWKIPVIGLSSKSTPEEEARMLDLGYFDFVAKPINAIRLQARVRRTLAAVHGDTPPPRLNVD